MSISPDQIDNWRRQPSEHQRLEFKAVRQNFDHGKLLDYCVAIANEGGGIVLLGIEDKPPRRITGTQAIGDPVRKAQEIYEQLGFRVDLEEVGHPEGRVVVIQIPSRPRGTAYSVNGKYLMRAGDSQQPMSEDRLRKIFSEGNPDWLEQETRANLSGDEIVDLLDTQTFFDLLKLPYPSDQTGVLDRLLQLDLVGRTGSGFTLRRLGALLLAKRLEDFPDLARKVPRVVAYSGNSKLEPRLDRRGLKGYAVGFQGLVRFVTDQLPQNEIIEDALRVESKLVPEEVIRELVANALVHQDFQIPGTSMMVEIYSNRLEISNPGEPVVPVDRFIDSFRSRNDRLADLMRRFGICEERSSGIDRVIKTAEILQLPAPEFRVAYQRTIATIFGPKKFEEMDRADRVRACYQHCALKYVMAERMTNQSLRERFNLSEEKSAITSQIISATIEDKFVKPDEQVGKSKKFARYLPYWA